MPTHSLGPLASSGPAMQVLASKQRSRRCRSEQNNPTFLRVDPLLLKSPSAACLLYTQSAGCHDRISKQEKAGE